MLTPVARLAEEKSMVVTFDWVKLAARAAELTLEISTILIEPGRETDSAMVEFVEPYSPSLTTTSLVPSGVIVTESG